MKNCDLSQKRKLLRNSEFNHITIILKHSHSPMGPNSSLISGVQHEGFLTSYKGGKVGT